MQGYIRSLYSTAAYSGVPSPPLSPRERGGARCLVVHPKLCVRSKIHDCCRPALHCDARSNVVRTVSPPCLCPLSVSCVSLCVCLSLTHISHSLITVFIKRASGLVAKQFPEIHESERETERHTQRHTGWRHGTGRDLAGHGRDPGRLHRGGCRGKRRGLETQLRGCRLSADPMLTLAQGCSPV